MSTWASEKILTVFPATKFASKTALAPLLLALASVIMFSATAPFTKSLLGHFSPEYVAAFRAFVAGCMALIVVKANHWRLPNKQESGWLLLSGSCVVIAFPFLLNHGLSTLTASQMGVVLAGMPLFTALFATLFMRERHSPLFWLFSVSGAGILFTYFYTGMQTLAWGLSTSVMLLGVVLSGGIGYSAGAKASKSLGGWAAICWTLVLYLPLSFLLFCYFSYTQQPITVTSLLEEITTSSIAAILYLALISQWYGFKFWYQAMAKFGVGNTAQLQLLMPFFTLLLAYLFLGEPLQLSQILYALAIAAFVFLTLKFK